MLTYIIIGIIALVIIALAAILVIRIKRFKPNPDKREQKRQLNADLEETGFAYENAGNYFYSLKDCWQRKAGYCSLYDEGSPFFNMIMDCEPITFSYGGKRWLIELWKGQYGITTGAEIGVYNTDKEDVHSEKFTGTFYEPISDDEQLNMAFALRKNGKVILKRRGVSWWLTAFKLGEFSEKEALTMDARIKFPTREMCAAFTEALVDTGYRKHEFSSRLKTVTIYYTRPHSPQPPSQEGVQEDVVQQMNEQNCKLYRLATAKYTDTLDKLEYVKAAMPELYHFMLNSLYAKAFFESFDWLLELIFGHRPKPPKPPCPPYPPCPPEPGSCCSGKGRRVNCEYYRVRNDEDEE